MRFLAWPINWLVKSHKREHNNLTLSIQANKWLGGGMPTQSKRRTKCSFNRPTRLKRGKQNRSKKEMFRSKLKTKEHAYANNDLDKYLSDGIEEESPNFNVLAWWKGKYATYHALAIMARDVLSIPVTYVAYESAFSTAGRVLDPFRSSLTLNIVEALVCTQDWLRYSKQECGSVEEQLEELKEIEIL
ncbi:zinc finger BED domain-containing protein RICESLEEPER 4-like [Prunus dulcis]|uniref:zinc finger BED domain-containing protein RICESLEEPER 4-like n=1 Tax=Prunus dulcis TaxID=3755 RepID=UPI001482E327|nr:zinc finger BED domain-containing protein RICESLEEPER 4-like [Prunus dulcis]